MTDLKGPSINGRQIEIETVCPSQEQTNKTNFLSNNVTYSQPNDTDEDPKKKLF